MKSVPPSKGLLITFEGNEGSGKSTQIKLLYEYLKKRRIPVFLTREPGGTKIGDEIRGILLDACNKKMSAETETLLYMASRAQLVEEVILPRLKEGKIVLCDRWLDATEAYQGYGARVDIQWIRLLGRVATKGIKPKLTIFFDLPLATGLRRAKSHKAADRMEQKEFLFHQRVRKGYLSIAKNEPRRFKIIAIKESDAIPAVREKVKKIIQNVLFRNR